MQTQILVLSTSLLPVVSFVDWRQTEIIVRGNVKGIIKKPQSEAERELILSLVLLAVIEEEWFLCCNYAGCCGVVGTTICSK